MTDVVPADLVARLRHGDFQPTILPDGSGVLVDLDGYQVLSMSKTGVALVQTIQSGVVSVEALARLLEERYDVRLAEAREDTNVFIAELARVLCPVA